MNRNSMMFLYFSFTKIILDHNIGNMLWKERKEATCSPNFVEEMPA
jgi:hypothetical protein